MNGNKILLLDYMIILFLDKTKQLHSKKPQTLNNMREQYQAVR